MPKLEMYYDYACPYCKKGYEILLSVLEKHPQVEVDWYPCEAHPRPEVWHIYSDLPAAGFYVAQDLKGDLSEYHKRMYQAACIDKLDIQDVAVLEKIVEGLLDEKAFGEALSSGAYLDQVKENNRVAWEVYGFPAVPSFKWGEHFLPAQYLVGVTAEGLEELLAK